MKKEERDYYTTELKDMLSRYEDDNIKKVVNKVTIKEIIKNTWYFTLCIIIDLGVLIFSINSPNVSTGERLTLVLMIWVLSMCLLKTVYSILNIRSDLLEILNAIIRSKSN